MCSTVSSSTPKVALARNFKTLFLWQELVFAARFSEHEFPSGKT